MAIRYVAGDNSCVFFWAVQVVESPREVVLTVLARQNRNQNCASMLVVGKGTVSLAAPLGQRRLVHGPVSKSWLGTGSDL